MLVFGEARWRIYTNSILSLYFFYKSKIIPQLIVKKKKISYVSYVYPKTCIPLRNVVKSPRTESRCLTFLVAREGLREGVSRAGYRHLVSLIDSAETEGWAPTAGLLDAARGSVCVQLGNDVILSSSSSFLSVTLSYMASQKFASSSMWPYLPSFIFPFLFLYFISNLDKIT